MISQSEITNPLSQQCPRHARRQTPWPIACPKTAPPALVTRQAMPGCVRAAGSALAPAPSARALLHLRPRPCLHHPLGRGHTSTTPPPPLRPRPCLHRPLGRGHILARGHIEPVAHRLHLGLLELQLDLARGRVGARVGARVGVRVGVRVRVRVRVRV